MPAAAPPPASVTALNSSRAEIAIVREINKIRRTHHLRTVKLVAPLATVARRHSSLMLRHNALTHSSFDGSSFSTRLARAGKRKTYGETLAWAPDGAHVTAKVLLKLWLTSAPHRHVLLNGKLHRVGVGRVHGKLGAQGGNAITADFSS
jgi:uncharacterized protein YkwD